MSRSSTQRTTNEGKVKFDNVVSVKLQRWFNLGDLPNGTPEREEELRKFVKEKSEGLDNYKFQEGIPRNLIVMGRSRSGKTTLIKVIENLGYVPPPLSLFNNTRKIEMHPLVTTIAHNGKRYMINLIDTPGFEDRTMYGQKPMSNQQIKNLIDQCISYRITEIHVFAFVFSLQAGINSDDVKSMKFIQRNYPNLGKHFALVLTHCEDYNEVHCRRLIKDFFETDEIKECELQSFFGLGVYCMGCIDQQSFTNDLRDAINYQIENIKNFREKFIDLIVKQREFYNIHNNENGTGVCCLL